VFIQRIIITFEPPASRYGRKLPEVTRAAFRAGMLYWHRTFAPKHFQPGAAEKYRHKRRTKKYQRTKRILAARGKVRDGGRLDLVHSGLTRRKVLARPYIRAYPKRATLHMATPSYVRMVPNRSNHPHMAKEITAVTPQERVQLMQVIGTEAERQLKAIRDTRTVVIS